MEFDVLKKILNGLLEKTDKNLIGWSKTSSSNEYKTRLGKSSLTVDSWFNTDNGKHYADLVIYNSDGDPIDRIAFNEGDDWYPKIANLHELIERRTRKVDETYNDIFDALS